METTDIFEWILQRDNQEQSVITDNGAENKKPPIKWNQRKGKGGVVDVG